MAKNIIICCDGTGNEIKENQSNVLKFFRVLEKTENQLVFYDTGVGTIGNSGAWSAFRNKAKGVFGLATGYGMDQNVLDAYRFLIRNYQEGDQVYLFGFSRGAYTVRMLAGFINLVGVLHLPQEHLASHALTAYKQTSYKQADGSASYSVAWRVQEVLDAQRITIRFMGCWDTVGSVIVPRPDRFYFPSLQSLPYIDKNPCVEVFRHAIAIDERRRMFRLRRWAEPQLFKTNPFVKDDKASPQDIKQVWFAGVHSDIGGGYPEKVSGAAKIPLGWMVEEAQAHGVTFRREMVKRLVRGIMPKKNPRHYTAPSPTAKLHNSMNWGWKILEFIPKRARRRDHPDSKNAQGLYFPNSEHRHIPQTSDIHPTVWERVDSDELKKPYKPKNLPPKT